MFEEKSAEEIALLTPAELKAYNKAKEAHEKGADKDKSAGAVKEFYDKKGAETLENFKTGGTAATVNLTNKTEVEFIADHGFFKKGHRQEVSDVALEIYTTAGVIKKL